MTDREPMVASSLERIFPIPGVTEDWDDVLERAGEESALRPETGLFRKRPARVAIAFVALAAVAVAALLIGAPWKSSPGFLERAQAGLVPPPRSILHQRFETTVTSKDFGCTVTTQPSELWIDLTPPHRWRVLADDFIHEGPRADPRTFACASRGVTELGGSLGAARTLELVLPNTLTFSPRAHLTPPGDSDYATTLREAIASGIAHDEGMTELDGREVRRIRYDHCSGPPCDQASSYAYVDPESFHPVQEVWPSGYVIVNRDGVFRFDVEVSYLTYEYLPRTPANVALTDIRAQHPGARGPETKGAVR
jgi:hypothetical protein